MRLLALGVDYRSAPAAVREGLAFNGDKLHAGLDLLTRTFPNDECVILSTCNRVEVYLASNYEQVAKTDALTELLGHFHGINSELFAAHLVTYHDEAVIGHLFRVAASLESLVLGEGQILGQVRDAYNLAVTQKTVGPIFHTVFQSALRVGKLVRERTGMNHGKLSIASVAVDLANEVFDSFADKTVLVIGAGKMGELTLQHLKGLNPGKILVTNRDLGRSAIVAERWNGQAISFERLEQARIEADLIISTTAATEPIVTLEQFILVQRARRNRLALILDIAIPRDFDPRIGDLDQVTLYHVDDLQGQVDQNRLHRQKGIDPALIMVEHQSADCYAKLRNQRDVGLLLQQLGNHADQIRQRELSTLFASRAHLTKDDREAIIHMTTRLQNQLLHHPRAAVRSAVTKSNYSPNHPHSLLDYFRQFFGLAERSANSINKLEPGPNQP